MNAAGYLLDTNVLSELRKGPNADPAVKAWQESVPAGNAYLSVISLLEIRTGIRRVESSDSPFAAKLDDWYRTRLLPGFDKRVLAVDRAVAEAGAALPARRTLPPYDVLIAATARVHHLTLATRNPADFADTGITVVNPWEK